MNLTLKTILNLFFLLLIVGVGAVVTFGFYFQSEFSKPGPLQQEAFFTVQPGFGTSQIGDNLENQNIIRDSMVFQLGAYMKGVSTNLKAGEYIIQPGSSVEQIISLFLKGKVHQYKFTIPEGFTAHQIRQILSEQEPLVGPTPQILLEGTILPNTYFYIRNEERSAVVQRLQGEMSGQVNKIWAKRQNHLPFSTTGEAVTLASIVEKEVNKRSEYARVAGLYINRLKKGMRLQADPTVIYGITDGKPEDEGQGPLGRRITREDLKFDSPYNTYLYSGLPPGPICSPSLDAIIAVLNPERHNFIFMVADGTGGHAFATNLKDHNRNVAQWRQIRKEMEAQ